MREDPTLTRIRKARHEISRMFGHDPDKLVGHYLNRQRRRSKKAVKAGKNASAI